MTSGVWRVVFVGAANLTLTTLLMSCTSGARSEPELGQIPVVHDAGELVLPLDAYEYTTDGYRTFIEAQGKLTRNCLRRFGVEIPVSAWDTGVLPEFDRLNDRRYGLLDLEATLSRGYQPPPELADDRQFSSAEEIEEFRESLGVWTPSDEETFLLEGRTGGESGDRPLPIDINGDPLPEDGCSGESQRLLSDGLPSPLRPNDAGLDSFRRAENDSRVQAALSAWSDCMGARGFAFASIWEPNDHDWPVPVTDEEIATATADVECKLETNLVGIWYAVESAYQSQFVEDHLEELAEIQAWLDTVYRNSAQVLGEA